MVSASTSLVKRLVSVSDSARNAVKFQQAGRVSRHSYLIWAGHRWNRALVKEALGWAGMVRAKKNRIFGHPAAGCCRCRRKCIHYDNGRGSAQAGVSSAM